MSLPPTAHEFRQCQNPDCLFRFPAPVDDAHRLTCPLCKYPTDLAAPAAYTPENQTSRPAPLTPPFELLLDNLRSAWNVGSILRSADGAGVRKVYLCGITPTPQHPRVRRTSLGAENNVDWAWFPNALHLAQRLQQEGRQLWALEGGPHAAPIYTTHLDESTRPLLILGNELAGVDPDLLRICDRVLEIPMVGVKRSLNVAVAFGIAVYLLLPNETHKTNSR